MNIKKMRPQSVELQTEDAQTQKIRLEKLSRELTEDWEEMEKVLPYQGLLYIATIVQTK